MIDSTNVLKMLLVLALLLPAACSSDPGASPLGEQCTEEGCPCIFAQDCPAGMNCINGHCSLDNPFGDTWPFDDQWGQGDGAGFGDGTGSRDGADANEMTNRQFGESCTNNLQCESAWCVDSPDGGYCSQPCELGCPEGWTCKTIAQTQPDYISICVQDKTRLCLPCEIDVHCGDAGDVCLEIGGGKFCGRNCAEEPCPTGYTCEEVDATDGPSKQCVPKNGACDCSTANVGQVRGCLVTNEIGTCFGEETCEGDLGWTGCTAPTPEDEKCDGIDNNCNGQPDEGFEPAGCEVSTEFGVCDGEQTCQGAAGWVCDAQEPTSEICNGVDDNCNDLVDEDFVDDEGAYVHVENCATCGNSCIEKFVGADEVACQMVDDAPTCLILSCLPGFYMFNELTCLDENSFLCQPCNEDSDCFGELSRCLQISETDPRAFCFRDCSGLSEFSTTCPDLYTCTETEGDELCIPDNGSCDCTSANEGQEKPCSQGNQFGICFGSEMCVPELGWTGCTAAVPEDEACDGLDNDCNGIIDEGMSTGALCEVSNEFGICGGAEFCGGEEGILCSAPEPAPEVCDGVDNDCSGDVDEGYALAVGDPPVLKYGVSVEHCGACGYACPEVPHGTPACDIEPDVPSCVVGECDQGYYDYLGIACLPVPDANLCIPCVVDSDCQGPDDLCIPEDDGGVFCARDCLKDSIYGTAANPCTGVAGEQGCCPDGYICQGSFNYRQCRPVSGTCTCIEEGKVEACTDENEFGLCVGTRNCITTGPNPGWSLCSAAIPTAEICDGMDNDCDAMVDGQDDSLNFLGTPTGTQDCSTGPACAGEWKCVGAEWVCTAQPATEELCDAMDNNCDGQVDEGFLLNGLYQHPDHCGACGYDCDQLVHNSVDPACLLVKGVPTCVASECEPGYFPFGGGQVCMLLPDNLCQPCGSDDDCLVPSSKCVELGIEKVCGRDCSGGSPYGQNCPAGYSCQPLGGGDQCVPDSGTCVCGPETVGLSRSCTVDDCIGQQTCEEADGLYVFTDCSAEGVVPEVCDGIDNDCDGGVDEGFIGGGGDYSTDENCGVCGNNCLIQFNEAVHHAKGECDPATDPPGCRIKECISKTEMGTTYEWVDQNAVKDDGCECKRVKGNLTSDLPDSVFIKEGEFTPSYPLPSTVYKDDNCDGIDGVVEDALFVSAANPNPGNGTLESPYQTINQALSAFPLSGKDYILVAGGVYEENVYLAPGTRLHGGYSPDFQSRNIVLFESEIRGQQPDFDNNPVHGTVHAVNITGPMTTVVSGLVIIGYDVAHIPNAGNGLNSYAVYIVDTDANFELRNSFIVGGFGGPGANGANGSTGYGAQSAQGSTLKGKSGSNAGSCYFGNCSNKSQPGGAGGKNKQCSKANGPQGGGVVCPVYDQPGYTPPDPGHDGTPGWSWTLDYKSGSGCHYHATEAGYPADIKKLDGGDGHPGSDGLDGLQGGGCTQDFGSYSDGHWSGPAGATGAGGVRGQAGGTGGASGGIDTASAQEMPPGVPPYNSPHYKLGATGGGGGAGGCGGKGGNGGGTGGASIGVFVAFSSPQAASTPPIVAANMIDRGYGGPGGIGGYGGSGGIGGDGGKGGNSSGYWIDFQAGDGGRAGRGGQGGGGGGGCGGASFAMAVFNYPANWEPAYAAFNEFLLTEDLLTGGTGGPAGPSGKANPNGDGTLGATLNYQAAPAP